MHRILVVSTFATLAFGQIPGPVTESPRPEAVVAAPAGKSAPQSTVTVAPGDTVVTIHGLCALPRSPLSVNAQDCTVLVQRQQFENLLKIVAPNGQFTPTLKRDLANTYTDLLAFQMAAEKSGIDNSPQFQNSIEWLRLRTLADLYRRNLEQELSVASEQEIDDFYRQHIEQFEEVKLRRMLLPKNNFGVADKQESEKKALEIATELRERAARGEDLDQLQKEAYIAAGFNTQPPSTDVGNRRRSGLSSDVRDDVFALRSGEVTKVEKEAYSFVIYKVEAKRTLPKERVRDEISREIIQQKLESAVKSVTGAIHADLNENYFEPASGN